MGKLEKFPSGKIVSIKSFVFFGGGNIFLCSLKRIFTEKSRMAS